MFVEFLEINISFLRVFKNLLNSFLSLKVLIIKTKSLWLTFFKIYHLIILIVHFFLLSPIFTAHLLY
ncbi:MAG: hypothetical protein EAZ15_04660 [Sphingobacteriales bacterium]|nr:MAG: hypothetical protein EAZ15_04660 [Sphingobacteriales bacterium]